MKPAEPRTTPTGRHFPAGLIRVDLADFTGYSSARTSAPSTRAEHSPQDGPGHGAAPIWLNANESGEVSAADPDGAVRRYPEPQPPALVAALAEHYRVSADMLVVGRGSDEAIELLIRTICAPGDDAVLIARPTFGMYAVSARLHGVQVVTVDQAEIDGAWQVDLRLVADQAASSGARIVFLASPGNPTGVSIPLSGLADLATDLGEDTVLVIDEAYQEFAEIDGADSAISLLPDHPAVVVLRTLSKAHALAAARVGVAIGHPELLRVLRRVQAPYPVPAPVTALALAALEPVALAATRERTRRAVEQRRRLATALQGHALIHTVYRSDANFVLVRAAGAHQAEALLNALQTAGIIVRDFRGGPGLTDALRITAGTAGEIDAVLGVLADLDDHRELDQTTADTPEASAP